MKAGLITAPRRIEIIDAPDDTLGRIPEELASIPKVTVQLEKACLCGSDSPFFNYDFAELKANNRRIIDFVVSYEKDSVYPLNLGLSLHECVGTVVETHSAKFKVGDFVLALPFDQHGFFSLLTLPENRIFKLPESNVSKEEILLCQPLGTIIYGFRKLPELEGKTVAIIGQGPIGLMMNSLLAKTGASKVIAVDCQSDRLSLSRKTGATHVINHSQESTSAKLQEINDGKLADIVIEAVGHNESAIDLAVGLATHDGFVLNFGVIDGWHEDHFPFGKAFYKNLTISHSVGAALPEHFLPAADMIAKGEIDVSSLLTHSLPFNQAQEAYELFVDRKEGAIKVVLDFESNG